MAALMVRIKPDKIIRIQEYRYQLQKRMSKTMIIKISIMLKIIYQRYKLYARRKP